MFVLTVIIIVSVLLMLLGSKGLEYLMSAEIIEKNSLLILLKFVNWVSVILMIFFVVSFLYYFGPAKKQQFRFISAGSTLATLLFIATTLGFKYYVNNFASYNALYGSIGTIIVIMMWLYLNSIALLAGFELNASILHAKKSKTRQALLKH